MIGFQSFVQEGVFDPGIFKAIFLAGGPGSGKSYVAGKTTGGLGLKLINSDDTLEKLLKKHNIPLDFAIFQIVSSLFPSTSLPFILNLIILLN